jgi:ketosteroid isomerase-like protein
MSQENVEVLRRSFEAWNRNDSSTLMACHDPDVVVVAPAEWPEAEMAAASDALRQQWEQAKASLGGGAGRGRRDLGVELGGLEPPTSWVRSTNSSR